MSEAGLEARVAELEAALNDLYEQVQMDESVGICLSDRVVTLQAGEVLGEGARKSPGQKTGASRLAANRETGR